MTYRIRMIFVLAVVLALSLTACAGQAPSPNSAPIITSANTTPGKVPDSLATIEAQAEDIIDLAPNGEWQSINADITSISGAWKNYQPQGAKDGASQALFDTFNSAFERLQTAAAAQDKTGTMQAANDMSAVVVDLFALYHPAIPADVGQLDVLERQIVLDMLASNFTAADASLAEVNKVWEALKPSVLTHKGEDTAKQFEASLAAQASALSTKDSSTLTREAKNGLEIVDALERLY